MTHKPQIIRWSGGMLLKNILIFTFSETDSQGLKPLGDKLTL